MNRRLINILVKHAEKAYLKREFEKASLYANQAIDLSEKEHKKNELRKVYLLKGRIQNSKGQYAQDNHLIEDAASYFNQAKEYSSNQSDAQILLNCGHVFFNQKNCKEAFKNYEKALEVAEKAGDLELILTAMVHVSRVFIAQKKFKNAFELAEQFFLLLEDDIKPETRLLCYEQYIAVHIKMGDFVTAAEHGAAALKLAVELEDIENEVKIINSIAITHAVKGEYKQAFDYLMQCKTKSEAIGFHQYVGKVLINIGNIFSALSNHEEAYDNYKNLVSVPALYNGLDDYTKGILYYNLGCIAYTLNKKEEAFNYVNKAKGIGETFENQRLIARSQYELIRMHLGEGQLKEALSLAKKVEKLYASSSGNGKESESHLANIAEINYLQGKHEVAIEYGIKAAQRANEVQNHKTRKRSYKILADVYKKLGDFENAYLYLDLYAVASEEFFKEMRRRTMIDLEMKYETSKKKKEIELLRSEMMLQQQELEYTQQLADKNEKVAAAQEEIRQFTYAVSHDLKEPLRMIGSFSKLLSRKYESVATPDDVEFFGYINNGVTRMSDLLEALLEYGRVGKHDDEKVWVNLKTTMEEITETYYLKIQEEKGTIHFEELPIIHSNRLMLLQLLQNLVANGLKFKRPDVAPIVKVSYEQKDEMHIIRVSDNGIGIAEEYQERIFQIFARLHKRETYEGTGIGLAMCKKIVNHLKGNIDILSEVGKGTTFIITFPKSDLSRINDTLNNDTEQ
jgi:signal transduction histidine kinase